MNWCCVIGGAGFIGQHLVDELSRSGRNVRVLGRRAREQLNLTQDIEYLRGDIADQKFLDFALRDVDEVIDLAHPSLHITNSYPTANLLNSLASSLTLFETLSQLALKKFVYVSSGGTVYGETATQPISEEQSTNPISAYGISKLMLEKYAQMYWYQRQLTAVCARPSNPYGEGQLPFSGQGFVATAIGSVLERKPIYIFGERGTIRDYIYVRDLVRGIVAVLDFGLPGECYNIGSGEGRSNIDVLEAIFNLVGATSALPTVKHLPPRGSDVPVNVLDSQKLRDISGWEPRTSFRDGIELTLQWCRQQRKGGPL
jgi:UDP-glucose 4-epimerase